MINGKIHFCLDYNWVNQSIKSILMSFTLAFAYSPSGVLNLLNSMPFMRALIDILIALQWKHSHLLNIKQLKFTDSNTLTRRALTSDLSVSSFIMLSNRKMLVMLRTENFD